MARASVLDADIALAARLVLGPRATRIPETAPEQAPEPPPPPPDGGEADEEQQSEPGPIEDLVLAAALASLPRDVLARLPQGSSRKKAGAAKGAGERRKSLARGRPLGARAGLPGGGKRLSLIDTLARRRAVAADPGSDRHASKSAATICASAASLPAPKW